MKLVFVPRGVFLMGSPAGERGRRDHEGPQHQVTIAAPLYFGIYEVTQAQWEAVMRTTPWRGREDVEERPDDAATYISWDDATEFCRALSKKTGRTVRLPTEAEWEYACRAGSKATFCYGDDDQHLSLGDYAWYDRNALRAGEKYAHAVGRKKPNAWGLFDMHGNVGEWCADARQYYPGREAEDLNELARERERAVRGGSWLREADLCRSAFRGGLPLSAADCDLGFRIVVDVQ